MAKKYYNYSEDKEKKEGIFSKVDKWKLFKQVAGMVASGCASVVVSKYLKANMPETENIFDKAIMGVGTWFITGIVGSKVAKYAEQELDEWRDGIISAKNMELEGGADGGAEA